jgi:hypothetical protein
MPVNFMFEGSNEGGTGSATMLVDVTGGTLTATVDNTSPVTLDDGTGENAPGITGFGFNVTNSVTLLSWELTAFQMDGTGVTIGGNPDAGLDVASTDR